MSEKIKLKKTLYIGLGGTGVSALLRVKKCFIDIYNEIPPMIGFLAIDTDSAVLNKEVTSNKGNPIKLLQKELQVCTVKDAKGVYLANRGHYDWVPPTNVNALRNISGCGAGQVRSNGRFIAHYNHDDIQTNIQSVVTRIHQLIPASSPYTVDTNINNIEYPTNINVFGSIAGGTGSGMFIDTLCLVKMAMDKVALPFNLYPWIVLPEVFRAMGGGHAMENVLYNSYGAIREFDFLQHLDMNAPAVNFGFGKINDPLFNYAFVINNLNQAGIAFDKLDDLMDVVAISAFLPANKMGDDLSSPFDNITVQKDAGSYDICKKKAWAASTGSAALIYDSRAVGEAYMHRIVTQLCNSLLQSKSDGTDLANKFVDHQDVLIRENQGRDDIINGLLQPTAEYVLTIDDSTTSIDIDNYIDYNTGQRLDGDNGLLVTALNNKIANTTQQFNLFISNIISNNGGIDASLKFIKSLKTIIGDCRAEMQKEKESFDQLIATPQQWDQKLSEIKNKGLASIIKKINEDAVDLLTQDLSTHICNIREAKRRDWAIRFYNSFEVIVDNTEKSLQKTMGDVTTIMDDHTAKLVTLQNKATSTSKFQLFLHEKNIFDVSSYNLDATLFPSFLNYFAKSGGLIKWIDLSADQINQQMCTFASQTTPVLDAENVSIDDVLRKMPPEKVKEYLTYLNKLAAPLWSYNTQGFNETALKLDRFVIIGIENRDTNVLSTDPRFKSFFDTNGNNASFASTHQKDRVYILIVENLLPIYAVNNFTTYQGDHNSKSSKSTIVNYLDEKWNNRINSENFSILPVVEQDNILEIWVLGFVFGYIHHDKENDQYWMRSKKRGDAINRYRFNLNKQRDVAFEIFKTEEMYKEIEELYNAETDRFGKEKYDSKIQEIKDEESYLEKYAQLSSRERDNLSEPNFKSVLDLITQEIAFMTH